MSVAVKICGLTDEAAVAAAVENGADYIGFAFFPKSPRFVTGPVAADLADGVPPEVVKVGLFVDPTDEELDQVLNHVRLDLIQLHGGETPARVDAVRAAYGLPVMKVLGVSSSADVAGAELYADHADLLMFDAKPPPGADRPGGNAVSFDWALMKVYAGPLPWLLAGGLTAGNVAEAVKVSGAPGVDVSSGVEAAPGRKDPAKIRDFIAAAKAAG